MSRRLPEAADRKKAPAEPGLVLGGNDKLTRKIIPACRFCRLTHHTMARFDLAQFASVLVTKRAAGAFLTCLPKRGRKQRNHE
jgi:hypothetical protein